MNLTFRQMLDSLRPVVATTRRGATAAEAAAGGVGGARTRLLVATASAAEREELRAMLAELSGNLSRMKAGVDVMLGMADRRGGK